VIARSEWVLLRFHHICGLRALLPINDLKFDWIAFLQTLVSFRNEGTVMHEHIGAIVTPDEAEAFCVVEPFYGSFQFHFLFLRRAAQSEKCERRR